MLYLTGLIKELKLHLGNVACAFRQPLSGSPTSTGQWVKHNVVTGITTDLSQHIVFVGQRRL